jgi:hypothetical protein
LISQGGKTSQRISFIWCRESVELGMIIIYSVAVLHRKITYYMYAYASSELASFDDEKADMEAQWDSDYPSSRKSR